MYSTSNVSFDLPDTINHISYEQFICHQQLISKYLGFFFLCKALLKHRAINAFNIQIEIFFTQTPTPSALTQLPSSSAMSFRSGCHNDVAL